MKYLLLILTLVIITSCYDNKLVQPGRGYANLTIKVFDANNLPLMGAYVTISTYNYSSGGSIQIVNDSTNNSGEYKTILLEGEYWISVRAKSGLVYFSSGDALQMVGGFDRVREYRPFQNMGELGLQIVNNNNVPIKNINVGLLSRTFGNGSYTFADFMAYKYVETTTNDSGIARFDGLPLNYTFGAIVYTSSTNFYVPRSYAFGSSNYNNGYLSILKFPN